ncbi:MAG: hypothetical protein H0X30_05360 [Anaerolineae bacterium]|nr:hypothetical protein [Anaerolineae bacterium]
MTNRRSAKPLLANPAQNPLSQLPPVLLSPLVALQRPFYIQAMAYADYQSLHWFPPSLAGDQRLSAAQGS